MKNDENMRNEVINLSWDPIFLPMHTPDNREVQSEEIFPDDRHEE